MTSLIILAAVLLVLWVGILWRRLRVPGLAAGWAYVPLVTAIICLLMALGLGIRG